MFQHDIHWYYPFSSGCCCNIDVWGIFLNIILQDAPFLAFRLLIIIDYKIITYMNVFFACKNTLVIMLQIYRLYVVHGEAKKARRLEKTSREIEIYNISGSRKMESGRKSTKKVVEATKGKSRHSKNRTTSAGRKDTGYSTATSDTSSSSEEEYSSVAVPVKKSHRKSKTQKHSGSTKRKEKREAPSSHKQKKRKEKYIEEEGTATESNSVSVSEVAVVEVVKEKKRNKHRKNHRKASTGSNDSN